MTKRIKVNNSKYAGKWGRISHTTTVKTDNTSSAGIKNHTKTLLGVLAVIIGIIIYIVIK